MREGGHKRLGSGVSSLPRQTAGRSCNGANVDNRNRANRFLVLVGRQGLSMFRDDVVCELKQGRAVDGDHLQLYAQIHFVELTIGTITCIVYQNRHFDIFDLIDHLSNLRSVRQIGQHNTNFHTSVTQLSDTLCQIFKQLLASRTCVQYNTFELLQSKLVSGLESTWKIASTSQRGILGWISRKDSNLEEKT